MAKNDMRAGGVGREGTSPVSQQPYNHHPVGVPQHQFLSVTEIERLAKAGCKIELVDVVPTSDPLPEPTMPPQLADCIWERWQRAKKSSFDFDARFIQKPFLLFASEFGDKAYVFVQPHDQPPFVIEDERCIFPSDALMAKLALLETK